MGVDLLPKYIWIIETIRRHGTISLKRLQHYWDISHFSNEKEKLPRRTFYNYRNAIEEIFDIEIKYDTKTQEYYIAQDERISQSLQNWILNTASSQGALENMKQLAPKIFLEDVPSAHMFLHPILEAIKDRRPISFEYSPFNYKKSSLVKLEPYFLNLFRQRWYVTGKNMSDNKIKTYALDRIIELKLMDEVFTVPDDFDAQEYTRDSFGVIFSNGKVYDVVLKVEPQRAKYLRALPLHHSQKEEITDNFSIFSYKLKLTPDFVAELMSLGPSVTILGPKELKRMFLESLHKTLSNYEN